MRAGSDRSGHRNGGRRCRHHPSTAQASRAAGQPACLGRATRRTGPAGSAIGRPPARSNRGVALPVTAYWRAHLGEVRGQALGADAVRRAMALRRPVPRPAVGGVAEAAAVATDERGRTPQGRQGGAGHGLNRLGGLSHDSRVRRSDAGGLPPGPPREQVLRPRPQAAHTGGRAVTGHGLFRWVPTTTSIRCRCPCKLRAAAHRRYRWAGEATGRAGESPC